MRNRKVIVINGFQRGGTNILWNILQSNPLICSPLYETGEILAYRDIFGRFPKIFILIHEIIQRLVYRLFSSKKFPNSLTQLIVKYIDKRLYNLKLRSIRNPAFRFKSEKVMYKFDEIKDSILCTKSINYDIYLTDLFNQYYENIYFIGLIRNGYALCESWIRRGINPKRTAKIYKKIGTKMINDSKKYDNYKIIKFEDLIRDPFKLASELFDFVKMKPIFLTKLRLKTKKVLTISGEHKIRL